MIEYFRQNVYFTDPVFLKLLIPLLILTVFWAAISVFRRFSRPALTHGSRYPFVGRASLWGFFILATFLSVLALAKPVWNQKLPELSKGDIEVIIVLDRSLSMRADDLGKQRLEIAKREAYNIESMLTQGDKAALFVFGSDTHRKIYLTPKFENVFQMMNGVYFPDSLEGESMVWDSDFVSMLEKIFTSLDRQDSYNERKGILSGQSKTAPYVPQRRANRIVILFTDGEDQVKTSAVNDKNNSKYDYNKRLNSALVEFRRRGLKIYPVGVGTVKGSTWLSLLNGYKKGKDFPENLPSQWKGQTTKLDKPSLMFLAHSTGVEMNGYVWTVENSVTTVKEYLKIAVRSNRRENIEFGFSNSDQKLWQQLLLVAVCSLAFGIFFHPFSGFLSRRSLKLNREN